MVFGAFNLLNQLSQLPDLGSAVNKLDAKTTSTPTPTPSVDNHLLNLGSPKENSFNHLFKQ
jgi:hypothetical protein